MWSRLPVRARPRCPGSPKTSGPSSPVAQARRRRRWRPAGRDQQRVREAAGVAEAEQDPGAGERDPAPGNTAVDVHRDDPAFGYRFIADELAARGVIAGENKVARLCSQQRIWSAFSKKRGLSSRAGRSRTVRSGRCSTGAGLTGLSSPVRARASAHRTGSAPLTEDEVKQGAKEFLEAERVPCHDRVGPRPRRRHSSGITQRHRAARSKGKRPESTPAGELLP